MEWYREQTIQLIDLFRNRPALWDTSSVHYRNKRMKNESLEQISAKLKCPKEEIAKKICTLRVQFSRENVKVKRARESGGAVYNPKWFGYQLLCFLNDQSRYTSQPINNCLPGAATAPGASGAMSSGMVAQNVSKYNVNTISTMSLLFVDRYHQTKNNFYKGIDEVLRCNSVR